MRTRSIARFRALEFAAAALALAGAPSFAGDSAAAPSASAKGGPVRLEPIAGSSVKRITLTAKAAERLDIRTGQVGHEVVVRKQMVSGMVVYPQHGAQPAPAPGGASFGSFGGTVAPVVPLDAVKKIATLDTTPAGRAGLAALGAAVPSGESWVVVSLSPGEFERIAKDRPARITPLYTRDKSMKPMIAPLSDAAPVEDSRRSMLTLHYVLPSSEHGLAPSTRVRVELQLAGTEDKQKVVPYNAVYYDAKGAPWVYVNTQPLTYERKRITVQRVVGSQAVLSDGPEIGTPVVTVGAALLYGTEIFGK